MRLTALPARHRFPPFRLPPPSHAHPVKTVRHYSNRNPRLMVFYPILAVLFLYLAGGLFWRQIIQFEQYQDRADRQSLRRVIQPGPRGNIFDRNGEVIVTSRPRFAAVVYVDELREDFSRAYRNRRDALEAEFHKANPNQRFRFDWVEVLQESRLILLQEHLDQINAILGTDHKLTPRNIRDHFGNRLLMPFTLVNDLSQEEYARLIEQLPLGSPISIYTDTVRTYPYGEAAAHVLGYVRFDRDEVNRDALPDAHLRTYSYPPQVGVSGLEHSLNTVLSGKSGGEIWQVDRNQYQYSKTYNKKAEKGDDISTSLDVRLQMTAGRALGDKTGAVVAIDVQTGEVLAMVSQPAYDLNTLTPFIPQSVYDVITEQGGWLNRAAQGLYPPGSTFKLITAIAGIRSGVIDPYEELYCASTFRVGDRNFPEHGRMHFGKTDLPKALQKSSNVYFYQTGQRTGMENITGEARRFGLDQPTGIELPFETHRMNIPSRESFREARGYGWRIGDTANLSIGQGDLMVTPLQMAAFAASLARCQTRTDVTILKREPGEVVNHGGEPIGITQQQYDAIIDGMTMVVAPGGTGRRAAIPGMAIAGKTGTAQVKRINNPTTIAWFLGFAPARNPQIAVVVVIEGLTSTDEFAGGSTAAPIARAVFEQYFKDRNTTAEAGIAAR